MKMPRMGSVPQVLVLALLAVSCLLCLGAAGEMCNTAGTRTTETVIDSPVETIEWIRGESATVAKTEAIYVVSTRGTLYRSVDEGLSWREAQIGPVHAIARTNSTDKQWFFNPATGKLWQTKDRGRTYQAVATDKTFRFVQAHPIWHDTALALIDRGTKKDLYVTMDFGVTWTLKRRNVLQADWGSAGVDGAPEGNIYALTDDHSFERTKNMYGTPEYYSLSDSLAFLYHKGVVFVVRRSSRGDLELWSSVNDGDTFTRAIFPKGESVEEKKYTIVDIDEGVAFINVDHSLDGRYGTTYGSDAMDKEFVEVLQYNKRSQSGQVDFRRVFGLDGIYFANRYNSSSGVQAQSVVSYNKGADWAPIKAPTKDIDGNTIKCDKDCGLHLIGRSDATKFTNIYSNENAVGLVIANGNVGTFVDKDHPNTYLSRDAGQTWIQIAKNANNFEIANHGAITLLVADSQLTTELKYSWTQGLSFFKCSFTTTPVQVTDIATEPDNRARTFIIYGQRADQTGVLIHVDFNGAQRECLENDFEEWSPLGSKCLLGQRVVYQRRKQDSVCFVNRDHQPILRTETCVCVEEDYECDFCYEPVGANPPLCKKVCDDFDPKKEPPECIDYWYETKGYRLIPGNTCKRTGDVSKALEPVKHRCGYLPDNGTRSGGSSGSELGGGAVFGIVLVILFILVGGLVLAGFILSITNQQFREMTSRFIPQRFLQLGGSSPNYNAHERRPRASAGYAKVDAGAGSLLDDDTSLGSSSTSGSINSPTTDEDDDFNPRL